MATLAGIGLDRRLPDAFDQVAEFRDAAARYVAVIDDAEAKTVEQLLAELSLALPRLYEAGMRLPRTAASDQELPDGRRLTQEQWTAIYSRLEAALGSDDRYWDVEPFEEKHTPLVGSLADDLADIYGDVSAGSDLYAAGEFQDDVVWEWRLSFWSHWGRHAVDALRVVHARLTEAYGAVDLIEECRPNQNPLAPTSR